MSQPSWLLQTPTRKKAYTVVTPKQDSPSLQRMWEVAGLNPTEESELFKEFAAYREITAAKIMLFKNPLWKHSALREHFRDTLLSTYSYIEDYLKAFARLFTICKIVSTSPEILGEIKNALGWQRLRRFCPNRFCNINLLISYHGGIVYDQKVDHGAAEFDFVVTAFSVFAKSRDIDDSYIISTFFSNEKFSSKVYDEFTIHWK